MYNRLFNVAMAVAAVAGAQSTPQRATMVGGGNPNGGQCTISVVVDGQAEIEIRGSEATMRDIGGAPPHWRRFECTAAMPPNPGNFQFTGLNGRGNQNLVTEPGNGGPAVVRIEDSADGASEYTFRLAWSNYPAGRDRGPSGVRDDHGFQGDPDHRGDNDRQDGDAFYRDRDTFSHGNNGHAMLFQRISEDLDRATSGVKLYRGDRQRLGRIKYQLNDLQTKIAQGTYDERELNEVVGSLQTFAGTSRLAPRDRDVLTEDLKRLDDFRRHHESYGAR